MKKNKTAIMITNTHTHGTRDRHGFKPQQEWFNFGILSILCNILTNAATACHWLLLLHL